MKEDRPADMLPQPAFEINSTALEKKMPRYWKWLEESPVEPHIMAWTKFGLLNVVMLTEPDHQGDMWLHSLYHPGLSQKLISDQVAGNEHIENGYSIIVGLGLGHVLASMLDQAPESHRVAVFEINPTLVKLALNLKDFSADIESGRLEFVLPDEVSIRRWWVGKSAEMAAYEPSLLIFWSQRDLSEKQAKMIAEVQKHWTQAFGRVQGMRAISSSLVENIMLNWQLLNRSVDWEMVRQQTEGKPVVIVSGGPSLAQSFDLIGELQKKALVIAPAQLLKALELGGITPDIVAAVDYNNESYRTSFEPFYDCGLPLAGKSTLAAEHVGKWQGPRMWMPDHRDFVVSDLMDSWLNVMSHNNVLHVAYDCAARLKAGHVFLVACDLAITGDQAEGSLVDPAKYEDAGPVHRIFVHGVDGKEWPTQANLMACLSILERQIEAGPPTTNLSLRGAAIRSTTHGLTKETTKLLDEAVRPEIDWSACEVDRPDDARQEAWGNILEIKNELTRLHQTIPLKIKQLERETGDRAKVQLWLRKAWRFIVGTEIVFTWLYEPTRLQSIKLMAEARKLEGQTDVPMEQVFDSIPWSEWVPYLKEIRPKLKYLIDGLATIMGVLKPDEAPKQAEGEG